MHISMLEGNTSTYRIYIELKYIDKTFCSCLIIHLFPLPFCKKSMTVLRV